MQWRCQSRGGLLSISHMPDTLNLLPPSWRDRIYYEIDRLLSWSPVARFFLLGSVSFGLIFICSLLHMVFSSESVGILSALWWALIRVIDTGAFGDEETYSGALIAFICSLCGLVVVASLIGRCMRLLHQIRVFLLITTVMQDWLVLLFKNSSMTYEKVSF